MQECFKGICRGAPLWSGSSPFPGSNCLLPLRLRNRQRLRLPPAWDRKGGRRLLLFRAAVANSWCLFHSRLENGSKLCWLVVLGDSSRALMEPEPGPISLCVSSLVSRPHARKRRRLLHLPLSLPPLVKKDKRGKFLPLGAHLGRFWFSQSRGAAQYLGLGCGDTDSTIIPLWRGSRGLRIPVMCTFNEAY